MRTGLAFFLLALVMLASGLVSADVDVEYVGGYGGAQYGAEDGGDDGGYGDGYGDGYGGHGHGRWDDVEIFLRLRELLIEAATNAVGYSGLSSLNSFNEDVVDFPYAYPGTLTMYVRELEKIPPYYKYNLHKPARSLDIAAVKHDMK